MFELNKISNKATVITIGHLLLFLLVPFIWILLYSIINFRPSLWYLIALQAIISSYFLFVRPRLFIPSLFFVCLLLTRFLILPLALWLINILIAVIAIYILSLIIKPVKSLMPPLPIGRITKNIIIYIVLAVVISAAALIAWNEFAKPDIGNLIADARKVSGDHLLMAIIAFSIFNALAEELMFRWLLWDGLKALLNSATLIIVFQAIIFGLSHYVGFPNGWLGVAMATIYGLMLGFIRFKSQGLAAPFLTHIFADLTIIIVVFGRAGMI